MSRIFGTRKAREYAANNSAAPDIEYPDLPVPLLKLIFEGPLIVNRRHDSYALILDGCMMAADELNISNWLLREYGEKLNAEQFGIAQELLLYKLKMAIDEDQRELKRSKRFNKENWLNGDI